MVRGSGSQAWGRKLFCACTSIGMGKLASFLTDALPRPKKLTSSASVPGKPSGKSGVELSTPVHPVSTPLVVSWLTSVPHSMHTFTKNWGAESLCFRHMTQKSGVFFVELTDTSDLGCWLVLDLSSVSPADHSILHWMSSTHKHTHTPLLMSYLLLVAIFLVSLY